MTAIAATAAVCGSVSRRWRPRIAAVDDEKKKYNKKFEREIHAFQWTRQMTAGLVYACAMSVFVSACDVATVLHDRKEEASRIGWSSCHVADMVRAPIPGAVHCTVLTALPSIAMASDVTRMTGSTTATATQRTGSEQRDRLTTGITATGRRLHQPLTASRAPAASVDPCTATRPAAQGQHGWVGWHGQTTRTSGDDAAAAVRMAATTVRQSDSERSATRWSHRDRKI